MPSRKSDERRRRLEFDRAAEEIVSLRSSLDDAYAHFNQTTDSGALDACIFEINALRARYNTALKHYRDRYY